MIEFDYGIFYKDAKHAFIFVSTGSSWKNIEDYALILNFLKEQNIKPFFFIIPWHFKHGENYYYYFKNNSCDSIILCNDAEEVAYFQQVGIPCLHINQNCWLDYKNTYIHNEYRKKYDTVYTACNREYKNHSLLLTQTDYSKAFIYYPVDSTINLKQYNPKGLYKDIKLNKVVSILNQSKVGLCLSTIEGSCYASSEYLLCGLPVVSVENKGGRNFWYNSSNSIVTAPKAEAIDSAIKNILKNYDAFYPKKIRAQHVALQDKVRLEFLDYIKILFYKKKIKMVPAEVLRKSFFNKMIRTENFKTFKKDFLSLNFKNLG
jgi:glycosyltransferase involved in cell wall biosynthesis